MSTLKQTSIAFATMVALTLGVIAITSAQTSAQISSSSTSTPTTRSYGEEFHAQLTGAQEVPAVETSTTGYAHLGTLNSNGRTAVHYKIEVDNGDAITAAHLHCGVPGKNGPVIVGLFDNVTGLDVDGVLVEGNIMMSDITENLNQCNPGIQTTDHLVQAFREGSIYVNVHSAEHPNGEVRGQVMRGVGMAPTPIEDDDDGDMGGGGTDIPTSDTAAADLRVIGRAHV